MENNHGQHSSRRINFLASKLPIKSYLEIGVNRGYTFGKVGIKSKYAVDPKFLFDWSGQQSETTRFFQQTSDEFFLGLPVSGKFDLVFLDGLHTFEQTYADFCNSLAHSHAQTIWLIDDTWPIDAYSAIPRQDEALAARRAAGGKSGAWHGDVFKVVAMLHDYHLGLDYRTIFDEGNPQTLVWSSKGFARRRRFEHPEAISRLSYFELAALKEQIFRPSAEQDALRACIDAVTRTAAED